MNEINPTINPILQELAVKPVKKENELDKNAFLRLMVTQLNNQDPLNPQDSGEFISQLAQFSAVEGIENLNRTFEVMAISLQSSQALQASALVGRSVQVRSDSSFLADGEGITGNVKLASSSSNLVVNISDSAGALVARLDLGSQVRGNVKFRWDGLNDSGLRLPPGEYQFKAEALVGGDTQQLELALSANVDSVTINPDRSVTLNLAGRGAVPLLEVQEIF